MKIDLLYNQNHCNYISPEWLLNTQVTVFSPILPDKYESTIYLIRTGCLFCNSRRFSVPNGSQIPEHSI